jgi:hypothetical protein
VAPDSMASAKTLMSSSASGPSTCAPKIRDLRFRIQREETRVEAAGAKALAERDAVPLGQEVIHSVNNPIPRLTGAIHVYGGDFFGVARSEWDAETLLEQRSDGEKMARRFEEANALWGKLNKGVSSLPL